MSNPRASARAFTLLEVLLATAMMAVLAASLYASLSIAFRARRSTASAVEPVRTCAIALDLLGEDLQSAVIPNGILAGLFLGEPSIDSAGRQSDALVFYSVVPDLEPAEGVGDVKKVEFICEPSADGRSQILLRRVTANLLSPRTLDPHEEVLCRGVFAFSLWYYTGTDWVDTWDSTTQDNTLPAAVEVTLQLGSDTPGESSGGYRASRIFVLPCGTAASNTTETSGTGL